MQSFTQDNNLFGRYPYKTHPQLKFKELELPARFSSSTHQLIKGGKDFILNVKHSTLFLEENDPETGQYHIARVSDETYIDEM